MSITNLETKGGLVMTTKFVSPGNKAYGNYIDYITRAAAVRNSNFRSITLFDEYIGTDGEGEYTSELFDSSKDAMSRNDKKEIKKMYTAAQNGGSLMWQTVISFKPDFLMESGIMDSAGNLNEGKLREYTRKSMSVLLEKEKMVDAVWSASIHKNTEHVHVHIATVQPHVSWVAGHGRCRIDSRGGAYQRGIFKQKSIEAAKSTFANEMIKDQINNSRINELVRKSLIAKSKEVDMKAGLVKKDFKRLAEALPDDLRILKYGNNAMIKFRPAIDTISMRLASEYFKDDFNELRKLLSDADKKYEHVYGVRKNGNGFYESRMADLRQRMGNVVLKQAIEYKKNMRQAELLNQQKARRNFYEKVAANREIKEAIRQLRIICRKTADDLRNEAIYEQLQLAENQR